MLNLGKNGKMGHISINNHPAEQMEMLVTSQGLPVSALKSALLAIRQAELTACIFNQKGFELVFLGLSASRGT